MPGIGGLKVGKKMPFLNDLKLSAQSGKSSIHLLVTRLNISLPYCPSVLLPRAVPGKKAFFDEEAKTTVSSFPE